MKSKAVVPRDPSVVQGWAERLGAEHGFPIFAGGETVVTDPAAPAPAVAPQATPAPAVPAVPAVVPDPAAQQPPPSAPGAPPAAAPPAEPTPDWAQKLIDGIDQLAPPAPVDPLAVELGFVPAPPQPFPGQPGYDPSQQGPAAGQVPQGALQQQVPAALPGQPQQPAGVPGQPQPDDPTAAVNALIDERARQQAQELIQQSVVPFFQGQELNRRRSEAQALLNDYPELKDPAKGNALFNQARTWAQETLGDPRFAQEPGYLETVHLAMKGLGAAPAGAVPPAPGTPGSGEVPIEGAGGAQPIAPTSESTQLAQAIVDARPGGGLNDLWRG